MGYVNFISMNNLTVEIWQTHNRIKGEIIIYGEFDYDLKRYFKRQVSVILI